MGKHADWIFAEGDTFELSLNSKSKELRTVVKHGDNLYTVTSDGQEFPLSKPAELELAAWYRANGTHFRRQKTVAASYQIRQELLAGSKATNEEFQLKYNVRRGTVVESRTVVKTVAEMNAGYAPSTKTARLIKVALGICGLDKPPTKPAPGIWKFRAGDSFDYDGKKRFVLEDGNTVVDANGDVQATLSKDNMDQVYLNTGTNFRRDKSKKVKIFDIWVNGALVGSEHLPINIEIRK